MRLLLPHPGDERHVLFPDVVLEPIGEEAGEGADHRSMNMLSALSPASEPIDPLDPGATIRARVAVAAQVKVMDVAKQMGQDLVALLDPAVGNNLNRSA